MLTPEQKKIIEAYGNTMLEISLRLHYASELHYERATTGFRPMDYECIAMTFRKIAELIVFGNLIGHEVEYKSLYPAIDQEWNIGKIINRIKIINPRFYPFAWQEVLDEKGNVKSFIDIPDGDWMTENELISMYGKCSDLIHAHNPFKDALDYDTYLDLFIKWAEKISNLISIHGVVLADKKHVITCVMNPRLTPYVPQVGIYKADSFNAILRRVEEV